MLTCNLIFWILFFSVILGVKNPEVKSEVCKYPSIESKETLHQSSLGSSNNLTSKYCFISAFSVELESEFSYKVESLFK